MPIITLAVLPALALTAVTFIVISLWPKGPKGTGYIINREPINK